MKIITLANQKGGCGKSTIVMNLAIQFALQKKRVILFDTDPQRSSYETLSVRDDHMVKVAAVYSDIIKAFEQYENAYDYAFIDTPPHDIEIVTVSIACSDLVIVPVQDSPLDIRSTKVTVDLIREAVRLNPDLKYYFLLSRIQPNTVLTRELIQILKTTYQMEIFKTQIANRMAYKYSLIYGQCVSEFSKKDRATDEILSLVQEIRMLLKE